MHFAFHTPMMIVYEKYNDALVGSPLLFVRGATRVKSIRVERDVDCEPLTFGTWWCTSKIIRVEWDVDREPLIFCT
jgi:hypothetical protein